MMKILLLIIAFSTILLTGCGQDATCKKPKIYQDGINKCTIEANDFGVLPHLVAKSLCLHRQLQTMPRGRIDGIRLGKFYQKYIKNDKSFRIVERSMRLCLGIAQLESTGISEFRKFHLCIQGQDKLNDIIEKELCE